MGEVRAVLVDPRDKRWADAHPTYRVTLWNVGGRGSADYDITGASLAEVLEWAELNRPGYGRYAVSVVVDDPERGRGLILLAGDVERAGRPRPVFVVPSDRS
jgi:hypothetical protein